MIEPTFAKVHLSDVQNLYKILVNTLTGALKEITFPPLSLELRTSPFFLVGSINPILGKHYSVIHVPKTIY